MSRAGAVILGASLLMTCCGADGNGADAESIAPVAIESTSLPPACTSTTGPATSETATSQPATSQPTTTEPAPTTSVTESDSELAAHQRALTALGYWLGEIDGRSGPNTAHAVTAFQKAEGLERTARLDSTTVTRLGDATRPEPRTGFGDALEVDLQRQIMLAVADGAVRWIFDISTGTSATPTPSGEFEVYREIDGFRHAPLGTLYRPKYFNGGIALHGYTSVPTQPASHGCVRLTYRAIDFLWDSGLAPLGTTVLVF